MKSLLAIISRFVGGWGDRPYLTVLILLFSIVCLIELTGYLGSVLDWVERESFNWRQKSYIEERHECHKESRACLSASQESSASSTELSCEQKWEKCMARGGENRIIIVGVDDRTVGSLEMKRHFGRWPFKRDIYPFLIRYFNRAKVKAIAFDLSFDGGDDLETPEKDAAFGQSVRDSKIPVSSVLSTRFHKGLSEPFILPKEMETTAIHLKSGEKGLGQEELTKKIGYVKANWTNLPIKPLIKSGMDFTYSQSFIQNKDGLVRQTYPFLLFENSDGINHLYPTLPLSMALAGETDIEILPNGNLKTASRLFDLKGEKYPIFRWYGDMRGVDPENGDGNSLAQGAFVDRAYGPILSYFLKGKSVARSNNRHDIYPVISFWDVLAAEIKLECEEDPSQQICKDFDLTAPFTYRPPELFKDAYVLVGTNVTNGPNSDVHETFYKGGNYHGVYIQANILDNYLTNDFIRKVDDVWTWLAVFVLGALTIFLCLNRPVVFSVLMVSFLAGTYWLLTIQAYEKLNLWVNWAYPMATIAIIFPLSFLYRYISSERRKGQLRGAFAKYVSSGVMQAIEKNPEKLTLGGQRKNLTMLFSDIRGFTTFSEHNDPEVVQAFLSEYFSVMNGIILDDYQGSINKLIGDAIMAYWGFPLEHEDQAFLAVCAALKMQRAVDEWNADSTKHPVHIGIGINTGVAMIGNVGSKGFMDFTVIGDAVNIAARLESANKEYGTTIIISESTYEQVKHRIKVRELGDVQVKGKEKTIKIFEPFEFKYPEELLLKGAKLEALAKFESNK